MQIAIDIDAGEPPFAQLVQQVKEAVRSGSILPGDPLPSIRQLANDLRLNAKTVAKAYRLLERDAVIEAKGYRGTFVHPDAKANSAVDLNAQVHDKLALAIDELRGLGAMDSEIRIAFAALMNK